MWNHLLVWKGLGVDWGSVLVRPYMWCLFAEWLRISAGLALHVMSVCRVTEDQCWSGPTCGVCLQSDWGSVLVRPYMWCLFAEWLRISAGLALHVMSVCRVTEDQCWSGPTCGVCLQSDWGSVLVRPYMWCLFAEWLRISAGQALHVVSVCRVTEDQCWSGPTCDVCLQSDWGSVLVRPYMWCLFAEWLRISAGLALHVVSVCRVTEDQCWSGPTCGVCLQSDWGSVLVRPYMWCLFAEWLRISAGLALHVMSVCRVTEDQCWSGPTCGVCLQSDWGSVLVRPYMWCLFAEWLRISAGQALHVMSVCRVTEDQCWSGPTCDVCLQSDWGSVLVWPYMWCLFAEWLRISAGQALHVVSVCRVTEDQCWSGPTCGVCLQSDWGSVLVWPYMWCLFAEWLRISAGLALHVMSVCRVTEDRCWSGPTCDVCLQSDWGSVLVWPYMWCLFAEWLRISAGQALHVVSVCRVTEDQCWSGPTCGVCLQSDWGSVLVWPYMWCLFAEWLRISAGQALHVMSVCRVTEDQCWSGPTCGVCLQSDWGSVLVRPYMWCLFAEWLRISAGQALHVVSVCRVTEDQCWSGPTCDVCLQSDWGSVLVRPYMWCLFAEWLRISAGQALHVMSVCRVTEDQCWSGPTCGVCLQSDWGSVLVRPYMWCLFAEWLRISAGQALHVVSVCRVTEDQCWSGPTCGVCLQSDWGSVLVRPYMWCLFAEWLRISAGQALHVVSVCRVTEDQCWSGPTCDVCLQSDWGSVLVRPYMWCLFAEWLRISAGLALHVMSVCRVTEDQCWSGPTCDVCLQSDWGSVLVWPYMWCLFAEWLRISADQALHVMSVCRVTEDQCWSGPTCDVCLQSDWGSVLVRPYMWCLFAEWLRISAGQALHVVSVCRVTEDRCWSGPTCGVCLQSDWGSVLVRPYMWCLFAEWLRISAGQALHVVSVCRVTEDQCWSGPTCGVCLQSDWGSVLVWPYMWCLFAEWLRISAGQALHVMSVCRVTEDQCWSGPTCGVCLQSDWGSVLVWPYMWCLFAEWLRISAGQALHVVSVCRVTEDQCWSGPTCDVCLQSDWGSVLVRPYMWCLFAEWLRIGAGLALHVMSVCRVCETWLWWAMRMSRASSSSLCRPPMGSPHKWVDTLMSSPYHGYFPLWLNHTILWLLPVMAASRYGYFPLWLLPIIAASCYGYFLLWLLPVMATSRYGYFPS